MNSSTRYSPEIRDRAVRLALEHQGGHESQWSAITSMASKPGGTAETLALHPVAEGNARTRHLEPGAFDLL